MSLTHQVQSIKNSLNDQITDLESELEHLTQEKNSVEEKADQRVESHRLEFQKELTLAKELQEEELLNAKSLHDKEIESLKTEVRVLAAESNEKTD